LKKILITQSNYIPWKGYFDAINAVDEFIIYDEVQYTRRDWRNRNMIKTPAGSIWLSIAVDVKGKFLQKISETQVSEPDWNFKHLKTIKANYAKAEYYKQAIDFISQLYEKVPSRSLSEINYWFLSELCMWMGINTPMRQSNEFDLSAEDATQRLVDICIKANATHYLTGPSAKNYMNEGRFMQAGITVEYIDYSNYGEYSQLFPPFTHNVSIIDLLFNTGPHFRKYMKSYPPENE
jgi:hypothetical protein